MKLVTVQGSMKLAAPAATGWARLVAKARGTTGVTPVLSSPAGAYRSEALVVAMWLNPKKYGASQGVARPKSLGGGGSVHQNGLCVDINNWRQFGDLVVWRGFWRSRTLDNLCAAQGFYADPRYPNEPWHYQHTGITPAGDITPDVPIIDESEEDDMRLLYVTDSVDGNNIPGWVLLNPRTGKTVILRADDPKNQGRANSWAAVWGTARRCTRQELANAQAAIQSTNG